MSARPLSLRAMISVLIVVALISGALSARMWVRSNAAWRAHQMSAYSAGLTFYAALQDGTAVSAGLSLRALTQEDAELALAGSFRRISIAPPTVRTTIVPIAADAANARTGQPLSLVILSPDLIYPLAELEHRDNPTAAETTGEVFRLLAFYCSDPVVIARMGEEDWLQVEGSAVWNCAAAPRDRRLIAGIGLIVALAILIGLGQNISSSFSGFALQLRSRRRVDGPRSYHSQGPRELREIVAAVNAHLEAERTQLESRAEVLSGVSHDLGTPATRLRLRTALIEDPELRDKLESDIDSMTGMIESVLTYTRAEMNAEEPRELSLSSLVEAIVADYQDTGHSVVQRPAEDFVFEAAPSVFTARRGQGVVAADRRVIVVARPVSLERAICNLIENALKYGRSATVSLQADAETATIIVDDEGAATTVETVESLTAPFQRGDNAAKVEGHGLGLTIVATIASMHGGALNFDDSGSGLSARLTIQRV